MVHLADSHSQGGLGVVVIGLMSYLMLRGIVGAASSMLRRHISYLRFGAGEEMPTT
jgi:hypothetical protein